MPKDRLGGSAKVDETETAHKLYQIILLERDSDNSSLSQKDELIFALIDENKRLRHAMGRRSR